MSDQEREPAYSTFEVARLCGVFHTTVLHWIRKGKLKAYATPGGHHRILRSELVAFMQRYDMPLPAGLQPPSRRILIVDDDAAIAAALHQSLLKSGDSYEVAYVDGPVRGMVEIGRRLPDLLVLDLLMPGLDGYEICRILKSSEVTRDIKIVAITASSPVPAQAQFLKQNTDAFLSKPLDPRKLVEVVRGLLG